jgi:hypothetical protein
MGISCETAQAISARRSKRRSGRTTQVGRSLLVGLALPGLLGLSVKTACSDDRRPQAIFGPVKIGVGPQLFLDDEIIDKIDGLARRVYQPQRLAKPVLDSKTFGVTQPYVSVVRDREMNTYRIWYNRGPAVWHAKSEDGIHWANPRVAWDLSRSYGASLIDDGDRSGSRAQRYKLANWQATRVREDKRGDDSGMSVGFSPDGFRWTACDKNPVLSTWPEGHGNRVRHGIGDIVDVFYDPLAQRYGAAVKVNAVAEDGYAPAPRAGKTFRRLVGMSVSKDFVHWERPWRILVPDRKDEGLLEFYGMGGIHLRGSMYIGLVRVLRDDLACDPGGPKDGIGYTVLATSRDGISWHRYREAFLDRNSKRGTWDHAMTWMSYALPVGDEVYFYYGGYARGHKVAPATERQIGLARMKKDRYVALVPTADEGIVRTRPFVLAGDRLTVNADATHGEIRIRLLDGDGKPIQELREAEAKPVRGDHLAAEAWWPKPLAELRGRSVRLEFRLRHAALFGFEFPVESR